MMPLPTAQCRIAWQIVQIREEITALAACFPDSSEIQDIANEAIPCRLTLEVLLDIYFREVNAALCLLGAGGTVSCIRPDPNCEFFTVRISNGTGEFGDLNIWDPWAKGLLFDDLTQSFGNMYFSQDGTEDTNGMPFLTFISAPLLTNVVGNISTVNSKQLLSVSFPLLETVGGNLNIGSSQNQTETIITSLRTVGGLLDIGGVDNEETDITALESVGGNANLGSTEVISAPNLHTVGGNITLGLGPTTTTVDITGLTTFSGDFDASGSALNVASVNSILVTLDAITPALSGTIINLSGGSSAAPTGLGAAAATNLGILNTVLTN